MDPCRRGPGVPPRQGPPDLVSAPCRGVDSPPHPPGPWAGALLCEGGIIDWDLGDLVASFTIKVKGRNRRLLRLRVGAPVESDPADRIISRTPIRMFQRKAGFAMDLQADKKVTLTAEWTDEVGNPTDAPSDGNVQYTVDNPGVILLTDNGDGTAVAAATGVIGVANVHVDATGDGTTLTGDLAINVLAGLAERINIVPSEPEETTPDEEPEPTPEP